MNAPIDLIKKGKGRGPGYVCIVHTYFVQYLYNTYIDQEGRASYLKAENRAK